VAIMTRLGFSLSLAAGLACLPLPASAQIGQGDAPVEITADNLRFLQNEGIAIYTGNVVATQADSRVTTIKLTATCSRAAPPPGQSIADQPCDELRQMVAEGDVLYTAPDVQILGDRAEYDYPTDTITITGAKVILKRGDEGVVSGTKVVYQVGQGLTTITADEDRVLSIFSTTKPREGAAPPATPQPAPRPN
jgi:lipopolysaccharide transport protein LptA